MVEIKPRSLNCPKESRFDSHRTKNLDPIQLRPVHRCRPPPHLQVKSQIETKTDPNAAECKVSQDRVGISNKPKIGRRNQPKTSGPRQRATICKFELRLFGTSESLKRHSAIDKTPKRVSNSKIQRKTNNSKDSTRSEGSTRPPNEKIGSKKQKCRRAPGLTRFLSDCPFWHNLEFPKAHEPLGLAINKGPRDHTSSLKITRIVQISPEPARS